MFMQDCNLRTARRPYTRHPPAGWRGSATRRCKDLPTYDKGWAPGRTSIKHRNRGHGHSNLLEQQTGYVRVATVHDVLHNLLQSPFQQLDDTLDAPARVPTHMHEHAHTHKQTHIGQQLALAYSSMHKHALPRLGVFIDAAHIYQPCDAKFMLLPLQFTVNAI
jgi:hypothetical protein